MPVTRQQAKAAAAAQAGADLPPLCAGPSPSHPPAPVSATPSTPPWPSAAAPSTTRTAATAPTSAAAAGVDLSEASAGRSRLWAGLATHLARAASDAIFELPPQQESIAFTRLSSVLAKLCELVYSRSEAAVGEVTHFPLPLAGHPQPVSAAAELVHFRSASREQALSSPQQYGIWRVDGLGLAIVFRGTASIEDVLIDTNIVPVPLASSQDTAGISVHNGFYHGAQTCLAAIVDAVRALGGGGAASRRLPVWVSGHSLGGGYANCLMLEMLASRSCAELFAAGGGSVTFGAPMVLYGQDTALMYRKLQALEAWAERQTRSRHPPLQFHNFVNGADIVPRLLGSSLESVAGSVAAYVSYVQGMQAITRHYHPFGTYHFIIGKRLHTPAPAAAAPAAGAGRIGDAEYAKQIVSQLDIKKVYRAMYANTKGGAVADHLTAGYQAGIQEHLTALASRTHSARPLPVEPPAANAAQLFDLGAAAATERSPSTTEQVGAHVGAAGQLLLAAAGRSASSYLWESVTAVATRAGSSSSAGGQGAAAASGSPSETHTVQPDGSMLFTATQTETRTAASTSGGGMSSLTSTFASLTNSWLARSSAGRSGSSG